MSLQVVPFQSVQIVPYSSSIPTELVASDLCASSEGWTVSVTLGVLSIVTVSQCSVSCLRLHPIFVYVYLLTLTIFSILCV